jgi:hypothetical protein
MSSIAIDDWKVYNQSLGIWSASVPVGLESRHFYADQHHAQRARQEFNRTWITNVTDGFYIVDDQANFLMTLPGIEYGEIRGIDSFTDRYIPVDHVGDNKTIVMAQPAFQNNVIGYDTIPRPNADGGFFIENVLALLDDENEYYLNSTTGTIFYKPPNGRSPKDLYLVLAKLEQLLILSGTYDEPVHDLTFQGFNYMHTTWSMSTLILRQHRMLISSRLPIVECRICGSADRRLHWTQQIL